LAPAGLNAGVRGDEDEAVPKFWQWTRWEAYPAAEPNFLPQQIRWSGRNKISDEDDEEEEGKEEKEEEKEDREEGGDGDDE